MLELAAEKYGLLITVGSTTARFIPRYRYIDTSGKDLSSIGLVHARMVTRSSIHSAIGSTQ